jgi:hypothetical protein
VRGPVGLEDWGGHGGELGGYGKEAVEGAVREGLGYAGGDVCVYSVRGGELWVFFEERFGDEEDEGSS